MNPNVKVGISAFVGSFLAILLVSVGQSLFAPAGTSGGKRAPEASPQAKAAAAANSSGRKNVFIATGGTGGVYYPLGGVIATVLTSAIPGLAAAHQSTSGSVDNIQRVADGRSEIGFAQADTAWDAYKGYGKFSSALPIRAIAVLYPERLQVVTMDGSPINNVRDLRGKRVSTGAPGSGVEFWGLRLLSANGLDPDKDIVRSSLTLAEATVALKERKIDAFIWAGGVPTKGIADFALEPNVKIKLLDTGSTVSEMLHKHGPVYTEGQIPADTYAGQSKPVRSADVWTLLVVREDMDEKLVYEIVKALMERQADLVAGHAQARDVNLSHQVGGGSPIPFHPGAKKYYVEKGLRIN